MAFIDKIKILAKSNLKTIVLPEAEEIRVLKATEKILQEDFAHIILVGDEERILKIAQENNINIEKAKIVNPQKSNNTKDFAKKLYELRKHKGMTEEEAERLVLDPIHYGVMMVKQEIADGLVSGAIHSTADTLRPALQILRTAPNTKLVSAFFIMEVPNCNYGENGLFIFTDCALNPNPNEEELAEIAIASSNSFKALIGKEPKIAMLSYSTHGTAKSESIDKVANATKIVNNLRPDLIIDGELQLDAAIIPEITRIKAPNSPLKGEANILVFPNLDAGNIGYKLVQRFANAYAYGPLCQGIAKPVNDLSRGCSVDDIVGTVALTAVQTII